MKPRWEPLRGAGRAALGMLAVALIIFTIPAVFVLPSELVIFQPGSYQRALENQKFYQRFPSLLAASLIEKQVVPASPGLGQQAVSYLNEDDLTRFFSMIFPEDWTRTQAERLLQNFGDYANFQRSDLVLPVELKTVKARLAGDQGQQIASQIVQSWPQCSADDVGKVLGLILNGELQGIPVCRPPEMVRPAFEKVVQVSLQTMAAGLPDQLDLASPLTSDTAVAGVNGPLAPYWWQVFRWYAVLRWLFRLTPVVALAVLLWIMLLSFRSMPDMLHGAGQPLLMAGLIALVLSLLLALIINPLLSGIISNAFPLLPGPFRGVLAGVLQEVGNRYAIWSGFLGLATSVLGVILLVAVRFFEGEETP